MKGKEGEARAQIEGTYKRTMLKNHPGAGGSTYFAKPLNAVQAIVRSWRRDPMGHRIFGNVSREAGYLYRMRMGR